MIFPSINKLIIYIYNLLHFAMKRKIPESIFPTRLQLPILIHSMTDLALLQTGI